jgi:hypothetical protein
MAAPAAAAAQTPSGARPSIGVRGFFLVDMNRMAASKTFDAVVGSSTLTGFGAGADITNLFKGVFARVAFSRISKDGERVVVDGGDVFPIGIPLELKMSPAEIGAGWRFTTGKLKFVPYVGAGFLRVGYRETSGFAELGDNTDESFSGSVIFGGIDYPIGRWLSAGIEAQYRSIKDAIGTAGASEAFGEDNLGGTTIRFMVGIRK